MNVVVERYGTPDELSRRAADFILAVAQEKTGECGYFSLVLSGGSTPGRLYGLLGSPPFSEAMPWGDVHVFWDDERCVPPDHPDSNYRMAFRALLSRVPIPEGNVHRMRGEMEPREAAAAEYEREIRGFFGKHAPDYGTVPSFHLVLLGVGKDGHTASLFPGGDAVREKEKWVTVSRAGEGVTPRHRITLTFPVINNAERVLFLVSGREKRGIVRSVLGPSGSGAELPAARVAARKEVVWYLDFEP